MLPAVLNPVDIVVDQRSVATTAIDPDFDEPLGAAARGASITLRGQVNYGSASGHHERLVRSRTGDEAASSGHLLFRKKDLDDAGVTIGKGDRVSSIAGVSVDLEIIEVRHQAPLRGVFLLTMCPFRERSDVRPSS